MVGLMAVEHLLEPPHLSRKESVETRGLALEALPYWPSVSQAPTPQHRTDSLGVSTQNMSQWVTF